MIEIYQHCEQFTAYSPLVYLGYIRKTDAGIVSTIFAMPNDDDIVRYGRKTFDDELIDAESTTYKSVSLRQIG
jgi:hypothetical protein